MAVHESKRAEEVRQPLDTVDGDPAAPLRVSDLLLNLQRTAGNAAVTRILRQSAAGHGRASAGRDGGLAVAFYTINDDRVVASWNDGAGQHNVTQTALYGSYAQRMAPGHAYGVASVSDAIAILRTLPARSLGRLFFFGHGAGDHGDFAFSVVVVGQQVRANSLLQAPSAAGHAAQLDQMFLDEFARIAQQNVTVEGDYCWSARGELFAALGGALSSHGVTHYTIRGTREFFDITVSQTSRHGRPGRPRFRQTRPLETTIHRST